MAGRIAPAREIEMAKVPVLTTWVNFDDNIAGRPEGSLLETADVNLS